MHQRRRTVPPRHRPSEVDMLPPDPAQVPAPQGPLDAQPEARPDAEMNADTPATADAEPSADNDATVVMSARSLAVAVGAAWHDPEATQLLTATVALPALPVLR